MGFDRAKAATAGVACAALLGAVLTGEAGDDFASAVLWSEGMLLAGVWLTQIVIDWWRDRQGPP
jgi:hypothetical protein